MSSGSTQSHFDPAPYLGIDYSRGQSNFDPETGIHYGVIFSSGLSNAALETELAGVSEAVSGRSGG
jgi:hypothetical protein